MKQFYLLFECGARYPKDGFLKKSFTEQAAQGGDKPRKKDGRFGLCVWQHPDTHKGRPVMPDGSFAPCAWCNNTRANGRKKEQCFPEDADRMKTLDAASHAPDDMWDWVVTCYPKEMVETGE